jgi:hypothetical protein
MYIILNTELTFSKKPRTVNTQHILRRLKIFQHRHILDEGNKEFRDKYGDESLLRYDAVLTFRLQGLDKN